MTAFLLGDFRQERRIVPAGGAINLFLTLLPITKLGRNHLKVIECPRFGVAVVQRSQHWKRLGIHINSFLQFLLRCIHLSNRAQRIGRSTSLAQFAGKL